MDSLPLVTTRYGQVRGRLRDKVASFLGIPYAANPTGALRFKAPVAPPAWDGVRDAGSFGATPPKPPYPKFLGALLREVDIAGDDWLTVNVWTPDPTATGLPVMVWIHGGAFTNGNAALPGYDGHAFARDGVVLVTMNYRLGVDGFALLRGAPANRGLLDQIAALEWVRDNIAAFGGDPGNVTIFGESAGGMSVTTLLATPRARGLFAKAITQSGAVQAAAVPDDAAKVTRELGAVLGQEPTIENLAALDLDTLMSTQRAISDALSASPDKARFGESIVASAMAFVPIIDGDLLPVHPMAAITAGSSADIPLLTGTTADEYRLLLVPTGVVPHLTEEALTGSLAALGIAPEILRVYRGARPGARPGDLLAAIVGDAFFRMPTLRVAEARTRGPAPTFVYEFAWPSGVAELGACHALEVGFVFDNLSAKGGELLAGPNPPQALADRMHADWITFARTGNPGWPAYDDKRPVMVYRAGGGELAVDPRGDERAAWSPRG